jgi:MFS family permease
MDNRRILLSLGLSQALGSACVPISLIIASLTAVRLSGGDSRWSGIPAFLTLLGSSLATFTAGRVLERTGYRRALMGVCLLGMAGTALACYASVRGMLAPFLASFLLIGTAVGVTGLSRYAAAETSAASARARSMGLVILGSTVGVIAGPLLVGPFGHLAEAFGFPALSGPWLAAFLFYAASLANTFFLLKPEPKEAARALAAAAALGNPKVTSGGRSLGRLLADRRIALSIGSLVAAQWAMVLVMAITPLQMHGHNHSVSTISFVITAHFFGMYGLSFASGWLADRLGRMRVVGLGGLILTAACLLAPLSNAPVPMMAALFLLGLGWNFCFLGASASLSEGLEGAERGRIQGFNEALVSMASGLASLGSGLLFSTFGFRNMTLVGLAVSALPCVFFLAGRVNVGVTPAGAAR